jgi:hypothetical protein
MKPDILSRKGEVKRWVQLQDVVTLLYHVHQGAKDGRIGFEDAARTIEELTRALDKKLWLEASVVESALWSCNLAQEVGAFKDYRGLEFNDFVKRVLGPGAKLHPIYNFIITKEE